MDAIRRTSTLRRVATTASLAALFLIPASADAARGKRSSEPKSPVITSVSPLKAKVGQTLTIRGRHFRKGKGRNSVGFKRDGAPVVFIKSDVSTTKVMYVKLSAKLEKVLYAGQPARFHLRVLARRFGKQYTSNKLSPVIRPRPVVVDPGTGAPTGPTGPAGGPTGPAGPGENTQFDPAGPEGDCDGDKTLNKNESGDLDNDLLSDTLENTIGTNGCAADSDKDGVIDSYEYKSAVDLNDDEYQDPNTALPYPGKRPYPNPLNADAATDYDGDVLTLGEEYDLWSQNPGDDPNGRHASDTATTFASLHLSYSDGLQYSVYTVNSGRRAPALQAATYAKQQAFLAWADSTGYDAVELPTVPWWTVATSDVDIRDFNRNGVVSTGCDGETLYFDYDCDTFLSDDERDEDADGLTNYDEAHGRATPGYWAGCYDAEEPYSVVYAGTSISDPDSDGDGVRDGADDQDHDDLPTMMELSRMDASKSQANPRGLDDTNGKECQPLEGLDPELSNHPDAYGKVNPFDPCDPAPNARTCERHPQLGGPADPNWWSLQ